MIDDIGFPAMLDAVIGFALIETVLLVSLRLSRGQGVPVASFLATMAAGLALLLAIRCLIAGFSPIWAGLFLLLAGLAHGTDIWMRWRASPQRETSSARVTA